MGEGMRCQYVLCLFGCSWKTRWSTLTVHGSEDISHFWGNACIDFEIGTCAFVDVDAVVAVVSNRQAYEAGRPGFIECTAVSAVFKRSSDCLTDGFVLIPFCKVFVEMEDVPARPTSNGIGISAVDTLAALKGRSCDGRGSDKRQSDEYSDDW